MLTFNKIYGECYINRIDINIRVYFSFSKLLDYIVYVIYICPMLKNKGINELIIPAIYKFSVHERNIRPLDPYVYAIRVENATDKSFHISLDGGDVKYEADICKDNTIALMPNIEVGKLYYIRVERTDKFV